MVFFNAIQLLKSLGIGYDLQLKVVLGLDPIWYMAHVTRTHGERPQANFQPPRSNGLGVYKVYTPGQNKGVCNIYVDSKNNHKPS